MRRRAFVRMIAPVAALAMVAAGCGDDDEGGSAGTGAPTTESAGTTTGGATTSTGGATTSSRGATTSSGGTATSGAGTTTGGGAGAETGVIPPSGDGSADLGAFKLGVINSNDLFPDYSGGIEAAVEYANEELNGLDGRDIELTVCSIDYNTPDDTQRCANELAAEQVDFAVSTLNQFGTHMQILRGAGIPVIVGSAVSVPDYTTEGVYAISPGGGCAGTLTAEVKYAVQELGARRLAVPYYDIPSGVLCYADSEQKPIDVLKGTEQSSSPDAGTVPDLEREGFAVPATNPDYTAVATQILDYDPDAIVFSGPATVCFPLLAAMNSLGYSVQDVPFIMSTSCFDQTQAEDAGENAEGLYFVGSGGYLTRNPEDLQGQQATEAELYQEKAPEYGLSEEFVTRAFAQAGFTVVMSMVQRAQEVAADGEQVTGETLDEAFAATEESPQFGSSPISCSSAPAPYVTVCNRLVNVTRWDGTQQAPILADYYAMDLLDGTSIRLQPVD